MRWPAPLRASALKEQISLKEYTGDRVFLKMSYHPCVSGCGRSLAPQDGHDHCLTCLGIQHAEEAFVDGSCSSCGDMTISELRNRLRCVKHGGVPLPLPRSGVRPGTKRGGTASGGVRGDLRITVRASPSGGSHPSGTPQPAGVPLVRTGASAEWGTPPVSFGASPDDQMSVAASEGEPSLSGDDDSAALPPSGVVALSEPDPEMTAMLSRAAENVGLVWNPPPRPDPSRLDEWFLGGGRAGFQRPPPVPFFPEVHEELKLFQRLLGHMAAAAVTVPLGLLHMRPLQHWLYGRIPRWAWKRGTYQVQITPACRKTFRPWSDPSFLRAGVPLEQVSRHAVVFTDASTTGWGATYNGHAVSGVWTGPQLHWHINCLELLAVRLALSRLRGRLQRKDVLVRTDNTATVAYINRQGGLRSRRMSQLARHLLLWSQKHLRSLRAIHIPGVFNRAADELSRAALPGEWRLHPQAVQLIWGRFGAAQVDLFASPETTHCQEFYSLTEATLGTDALAHSWPPGPAQICVPPSEPTSTDTVQDQGGRGAGLVSGSILAQQDLVPGTHAPRDSPSLANSSEEGSAFSGTGHPMAPAPGPVETPRMVPGWDAEVLADLPQEVALTITSARAPSTRRAYTLKWNLFVEWCSSHQEDPRRCSIRAVLSFLQQGLERRLSPSTLKVYVAAISAYHDPVEGKLVGKHNLVVRFLRGARRLNHPRPPSLPSWDLALVLRALLTAPFEPLQSVELKFLSMKTLLLTALASIKRVGDLQAFSVDDSCLQFGPADSSATLRPRPGYVPKVPTTPFRDQVVNLQALPPEEADPALALLCPVRALRQYTDRTQSFRTSEQLFVCYGGQQKGKAVSKQRMAHWIVDAITLAYEAQGVPCPLRLRAHSTRGVASSWALARGASLADICRAAGWATPNTFARFYSLRVEPVSSCVLTSNW